MGNCCGAEDKEENPRLNANPPSSYNNDPSQYTTASREELAAAAERRLANQKAKNEIKTIRQVPADLPDPPNTGQGGLRWQVG